MLVKAVEPGSTTFLQSIGCLWVAVGLTISLQAVGVPPFVALLASLPLWAMWVYISIPLSVMVTNLMYLCVDLFFRDITSRNTFKVPTKAPVLFVCAPHSNQLLDPIVVMRTCPRRAGFLCAGKTMRKPVAGAIAKALDSIPVDRAQDHKRVGPGALEIRGDRALGEGTRFSDLSARDRLEVGGREYVVVSVVSDTEMVVRRAGGGGAAAAAGGGVPEAPPEACPPSAYTIMPHIDSTSLYENVFERLGASECVGIFPEGGSHDRTELLPLKMGVSIMALGASARFPGVPLRIVPVGLHYFKGHRFRGSVFVDYGEPFAVPPELVARYEAGGREMQEACQRLLELVHQSIASVTISAPDYGTLELFWMMRRLHQQQTVEETGKKPTLEQQVALTKAFSEGFDRLRDRPGTVRLQELVATYNTQLRLFGLKDHHVEAGARLRKRTLLRAVLLSGRMLFNGLAAFPGLFLGLPLLIATRVVSQHERRKALRSSKVKIHARDVVATYKVLMSLVMTPLLHVVYTSLAWWLHSQAAAVCYFFFSPFVCWGAVRCAESSILAYREAWSTLSALLLPSGRVKLRELRQEVKAGVLALVDDMGGPRAGAPAAAAEASVAASYSEPPEQWAELCETLRAESLRHRRSGPISEGDISAAKAGDRSARVGKAGAIGDLPEGEHAHFG